MEDAGTSLDPGNEEQEGQHGPFPSPSLGLEMKKLQEADQARLKWSYELVIL